VNKGINLEQVEILKSTLQAQFGSAVEDKPIKA
jgi:hypothetical protein